MGAGILATLTLFCFTSSSCWKKEQPKIDGFLGTWICLAEKPRSVSKLQIAETKQEISVDMWPTVAANRKANPNAFAVELHPKFIGTKVVLSGTLNHGFLVNAYTFTLDGDILVLTNQGAFQDNDGRPDYVITSKFAKEGSASLSETSDPDGEVLVYEKGPPKGIQERRQREEYIFEFLGAGVSLTTLTDWTRSDSDGYTILPPSPLGKRISIYRTPLCGPDPSTTLMKFLADNNAWQKENGHHHQPVVEEGPVATISGLRGHRASIVTDKNSSEPDTEYYIFESPKGGYFLINIRYNGDIGFKDKCDELIINSLKWLPQASQTPSETGGLPAK